MKRTAKTVFALLMVIALALSFSVTAFAEGASVTFNGKDGYLFAPGSGYTDTDLFGSFKNVMPGDTLTETIQFRNTAKDCDYIKVYLRAEVHDDTANPLTYSEQFENTDGNDQADVAYQRDETVASMRDFLSQLAMTIQNNGETIYASSPDQAGALADNVLLGELGYGETLNLNVTLKVPAELGNEYAHRVGEVDWVFLVEAFQFEKLTVHKVWEDNGDPSRPESVTVHLIRIDKQTGEREQVEDIVLNEENQWTYTWDELDDRYTWTVEEVVPEGYEVSYKTEDNTVFITNKNDYEPEPEVPPVDLTVKKEWSDQGNKYGNRPGSVTVTLYNGGQEVEKVVLSAANGWTYTWTGLDGTGDWSVLETGIPTGYKPYYVRNGNVVTITNMAALIQTGQLNWPIPVLGSLGVLMILFGIFMMRRKRKSDNA